MQYLAIVPVAIGLSSPGGCEATLLFALVRLSTMRLKTIMTFRLVKI